MNREPFTCPRTGLTVWNMPIESPLGGFWVMAVDGQGRNQGKRDTTPEEVAWILANLPELAEEWEAFIPWKLRVCKESFDHWENPFRV